MISRICTVCGRAKQTLMKGTTEPVSDVIRYSLYRRYAREDGKSVQFGMGGIDLCSDCWTRYAKPNRRAKKDR